MNFNNKNIWVTGASSGLGKSMALAFAKAGAKVIISGRNESALAEIVSHFPQQIQTLSFDMSSTTNVEDLKKSLANKATHLDIAILNAGDCIYLSPKELNTGVFDYEAVHKQIAINFTGTINCLAMALPLLLGAKNKAKVYAVSSIVTELPLSQAEAYGASKAALDYFFKTLRIDLANNVDVGLIRPGFVKTPLTDKNKFTMPFIMTAEAAAQTILKNIAKGKLDITFPKRLNFLLNSLSHLPASLWVNMAQRMVRI